jgi:hypothetical protein
VKKVTIDMPVRAAAAVRQVLFESQKGYGTEYVPDRVFEIREVITDLDDAITQVLENENTDS